MQFRIIYTFFSLFFLLQLEFFFGIDMPSISSKIYIVVILKIKAVFEIAFLSLIFCPRYFVSVLRIVYN